MKILLALLLALVASGCDNPLIDGIEFQALPNLETVRFTLDFNKSIKTDIGGTFAIKDYGTIFANPSTDATPFQVGFNLNLEIVNDQDYIHYTPTTTLPNGQPLPLMINRALAQIQAGSPVSHSFDVYGYADILGKEWIGTAIILNFLDGRFLPDGLTLIQTFLNDKAGKPQAVAALFGAKLDSQGKLAVPGGVALFANVASLLKDSKLKGRDTGQVKMYKIDPHPVL